MDSASVEVAPTVARKWSIGKVDYSNVVFKILYVKMLEISNGGIYGYEMPCDNDCPGPHEKWDLEKYNILGIHICPDCGQVIFVQKVR